MYLARAGNSKAYQAQKSPLKDRCFIYLIASEPIELSLNTVTVPFPERVARHFAHVLKA